MARDLGAAALRDLLTTTKDGDWGRDSPGEGLVPYRVIRGTDFPNVRIGVTSSVPIRYLRESTVHRRTLAADDILLETAGGSPVRPTGRSLLIKQELLSSLDLPATCASFARFLRVDRHKAEPNYVFWFLQYLYTSGQMEKHQVQHTGVARFHYTKFAESQDIPLPSRDEQRSIAHILGTLDDKIELNRRIRETLEAIGRAVFKSWFLDFDPVRAKAEGRDPGLPEPLADMFPDSFEDSELGRIPTGWEDTELGQLLEFSKGRKPSATVDRPRKGLSPVILINTLDTGGSHFASANGMVIANALDALMVMDGASSGRVETGHEGIVGSTIAKLTPKCVRPGARFLYHVLKQFEPLTRKHLTGTSIPHADKGWITRQRVALSHDVRLLDRFEDIAGAIRSRVEANYGQTRTLAALRDVLLPKLVSGELRMKDAERYAAGIGP
jgi:type I restriction enzyme S subunit